MVVAAGFGILPHPTVGGVAVGRLVVVAVLLGVVPVWKEGRRRPPPQSLPVASRRLVRGMGSVTIGPYPPVAGACVMTAALEIVPPLGGTRGGGRIGIGRVPRGGMASKGTSVGEGWYGTLTTCINGQKAAIMYIAAIDQPLPAALKQHT